LVRGEDQEFFEDAIGADWAGDGDWYREDEGYQTEENGKSDRVLRKHLNERGYERCL